MERKQKKTGGKNLPLKILVKKPFTKKFFYWEFGFLTETLIRTIVLVPIGVFEQDS